jgi:hypothetical protein
MDTKHLLARFARERQTLALMAHNGIARIYDAGATDAGRPYVAMELVDGKPITTFCDEKQLDLPARVNLMVQVCGAVEHAHGKGVIHRDLKPSNILVAEENGEALPKVIDFGIARATDEPLAASTFFTRTHQFMGSPGYMSPEQVDGQGGIDVRADVHALGAILYELLTGEPPLPEADIPKLGLKAVIERIQRTPVDHPGDRVMGFDEERRARLAEWRGLDGGGYRKTLTGPLADIVLKALAKNPDARYPSAEALATELLAWSADETVGAPRQRRRHVRRLRNGILGTTAAVCLAGGFAVWKPWSESEPEAVPPPVAYVPRSRLPDGNVRPVALYQFDGTLGSAIDDGPDMVAWGEPELAYEDAEIGAETAKVLHFPRFLPSQWLKFTNPIGPNGPVGAEETNSWTLVYDLMFPSLTAPAALFQCHSENFGEAEAYAGRGGIGSRFGLFYGEFREHEWYRIAVVSSHNGRSQLYAFHVNGTRWGIPWVKGMLDAGYAFDDEILLFCEGDQRTAEGYVNSLAFYDVPLSDEEISALGAPAAAGIPEKFVAHPRREDGQWIYASRLAPTDAQANDAVGSALSTHGDELWCTAADSNATGARAGAVYRYRRERTSGAWKQRELLLPPIPAWPNMGFGKAMAFSDTVGLIGAPTSGASGDCFLLRRAHPDAPWSTPERVNVPGLESGALLGSSVAFADESTIMIGAPGLAGGGGIVLLELQDEQPPLSTILRPPTSPPGGSVVAKDGVIMIGSPPATRLEKDAAGTWHASSRIAPSPDSTGLGAPIALAENGRFFATAGGSENAVLVYEKTGSRWNLVATLPAPTADHDPHFGIALTWIQNDTLAVGAPGGSWEGRRTGVVFLYSALGARNAWTRTRTIAPLNGSQEGFFGAALASTERLLWVGSPKDHTDRPAGGAVYFAEIPRFEAQRFETLSPCFTLGSDVALEGSIAAVGTPGIDERVYGGALGIFRLDDTGRWRPEPSPGIPGGMVPNGSFVRVGVAAESIVTFLGGELLFFEPSDSGWRSPLSVPREASNFLALIGNTGLIPRAGNLEFFEREKGEWASSLKIAGDGYTVHHPVALASRTALALTSGGVQVLERDPDWRETQRLNPPTSPNGEAYFGADLALTDALAAIGSPAHNFESSVPGPGHVHVFERAADGVFTPTSVLSAPDAIEMPSFGTSVAVSDNLILVGNPTIARGLEPGRVEVFQRDPARGEWTHRETLAASNGEPGDEFGIHVALDGTHAIVGSKSTWVYFFDLTEVTPP